ncbi:MAG: hypothetical protein OXC62_17105 [Aestuariivita sp.]|nr:hypothetical protein [Aestuariivita sp.]
MKRTRAGCTTMIIEPEGVRSGVDEHRVVARPLWPVASRRSGLVGQKLVTTHCWHSKAVG